MKKNATKILMAALSLIMALGIATGSTFAWFSLNAKVSVTGMQVTTQVKNNLQIANDTLASTSKLSSFKTNYLGATLEDAILEPVSTVDGDTFFYNSSLNTKASNNGDAINDTYLAYDPADTSGFNSNYGTTGAKGYVDYVFQLSANNTEGADHDIRVTGLSLLYNGAATSQKAFRAAIFVEDITSSNPAGGVGTLLTILRPSGALYYGISGDNTDKAVSNAAAAPTAVDAKIDDAATIATLTTGTSGQYKVVVRLWIEGEDTTCNNDIFKTLTSEWSLNITIELVNSSSGTAAVTNINNTNDSNTADLTSATTSSTITIDGTTYYLISVQLNSVDLYSADSDLTNTSKIYTVADGKYLTEVTNQCTLPAAP